MLISYILDNFWNWLTHLYIRFKIFMIFMIFTQLLYYYFIQYFTFCINCFKKTNASAILRSPNQSSLTALAWDYRQIFWRLTEMVIGLITSPGCNYTGQFGEGNLKCNCQSNQTPLEIHPWISSNSASQSMHVINNRIISLFIDKQKVYCSVIDACIN